MVYTLEVPVKLLITVDESRWHDLAIDWKSLDLSQAVAWDSEGELLGNAHTHEIVNTLDVLKKPWLRVSNPLREK